MEIVRLAESRPVPALRPATLALAVLLNGGLLVVIGLTRQFIPPPDERAKVIDVLLVETKPAAPAPSAPENAPAPRNTNDPEPGRMEESVPAAPRPGRLPLAPEDEHTAEIAPALWSLICPQIPDELRDRRPECRTEGDPFAARTGAVTAGVTDQSIRNRPIGDLIGGRFKGKDRYQIEVMLGLRSTSLGTKYHVPVDHGPKDEPGDLSGSDDIFGKSPIPDG